MVYVSPTLQLSRDLIKIAIEKNEIENFRIYTILRSANIQRGEFNLSQLTNYLNCYRQNTKKLTTRKYKEFQNSIFFEHIQGDKFRIVSYKKILIKYKDNANTTFYALPRFTISTRRRFMDACIGIILCHHEYSNKTAAKLFGFKDERRIQYATKRNNEAGLFIKQTRKVIEPYPTIQEAKEIQNKLKNVGIITSKPFKYKGGYAISVNRTNKYMSNVSRRYKGKILRRTKTSPDSVFISAQLFAKLHATQKKREQWFKPSFRGKGSRDTRLYYEARYNCKFYEFNNKVYSFNDFVLAHASI